MARGITATAGGFPKEPDVDARQDVRGTLAQPNVRDDQSVQRSTFESEALGLLDSLYRTALRLTRVPADAEDLVQDTYLKAFRAADRFEPGTNLRAWLFTILHNTARNRARDLGRQAVTVDSDIVERASDELAEATSVTPEASMIAETLDPELQAAIDSLPAAFREAVWLRDVEEFSYAEIARMLAVPIGTVMSRISRGRRMLFEQLRRAPTRAATEKSQMVDVP